jgi:hypothetical protein
MVPRETARTAIYGHLVTGLRNQWQPADTLSTFLKSKRQRLSGDVR